MSTQEFCGGVDHDVCAVLDRADQIRCPEGAVHHQGEPVPVGDGCDLIQIWNVAVGVAQSLDVDGPGVVPDSALQLRQIMDVHEGGLDPVLGQGVGEQVVRAPVDGLLGHDVSAAGSQSLDGVGDGGGA